VKRRRFLRATGYVLGAGALGLGGLVWRIQPRRQHLPLPDDNQRHVDYPQERKRVVVVGGGLAGLAAAIELSRRYFNVTLVERAQQLGGKLTAWTVHALGEQFPVEHGFHGFFAQYYNLRDLLDGAGVRDDLVPSRGYPVLYADRPPELFGRTTRIFPLNLIEVVRQSKALHFGDFRHAGDGLYDLMKYEGEPTFDRFDRIDFARFAAERGVGKPMIETVLAPFGKTTLNRLDKLSAAEAIRFFHFYFMGNPEGLGFSYLKRDSVTAVVEPLRRRFEGLGGRVILGKGARRLVRDSGRIVRVIIDAHPTPEPRVTVPVADVGERWHGVPMADGSSIFVRRHHDSVAALDGRCTHMGCPVALDEAGGFRCPCHGGCFDADGRPAGGPPRVPLQALAARRDGDKVVVGETAPPAEEEALECDYCVVACEVRGVQALMRASHPDLAKQVNGLGEADPYVVWRLWLDKPTAPDRLPFYTTSRFRYTDSVALYSVFQEPFIGWARRRGGSVVEVHAYAIAPEAMAPSAQIRNVMWKELTTMLPELAGARILHDEFQLQSNFTRWAPGDHARRPMTTTIVPNLMLAGDYVRIDAPVALMEAAAMSGRLAANAILAREGLRQIEIPTVALKGPLL
jgi:carotenoid phi-ring synthase / carotenoid chi-ring synthase